MPEPMPEPEPKEKNRPMPDEPNEPELNGLDPPGKRSDMVGQATLAWRTGVRHGFLESEGDRVAVPGRTASGAGVTKQAETMVDIMLLDKRR